jgi:hypothetical protein
MNRQAVSLKFNGSVGYNCREIVSCDESCGLECIGTDKEE